MKMTIPARKRFRIDRMTSDRGWCIRVCVGFPVLVVYWKYEEFYQMTTGLGVGWLPLEVEEGGAIPFRRWVRGR